MVLDGDDRPFASFLWPGNTADVTRLMPVVQRLRERFGIAQVYVAYPVDSGRSRCSVSREVARTYTRWLGALAFRIPEAIF